VFFIILTLTSLGLQLIGTFFLATQIIPKTWPDRLREKLQKNHEKLLKIRLTKRKQIEALRDRLSNVPLLYLALFAVFFGILFWEPKDSQKILNESKENYMKVKESSEGMAKIIESLSRILEWVIIKVGGAKLLQSCWLFLWLIFLFALYLWHRFIILNELIQEVTYSLVEVPIRVFSYFSKRQGEEIFAILGFSFLVAGFICQTIVNLLVIK